MHFFVPAHINVLVEIIHCSHTNKDSFNKVVQVAKQLGKAPVVVGNGPGFCGNRMCHALFSEAIIYLNLLYTFKNKTLNNSGFEIYCARCGTAIYR